MMKFDRPANDRQVTKEDVEKIYRDSPHYANKFYLSLQSDGTVRLVFADYDPHSQIMNVRTSVIIPIAAFSSFTALLENNAPGIDRMVQEVRRKLNETGQTQAEKPVGAVTNGDIDTEKLS